MPTLIRLVVVLLFLAGLVVAGMFVLATLVDPGQREMTVRIPQRDLLGGQGGAPALPGQTPAPALPGQPQTAPAGQ